MSEEQQRRDAYTRLTGRIATSDQSGYYAFCKGLELGQQLGQQLGERQAVLLDKVIDHQAAELARLQEFAKSIIRAKSYGGAVAEFAITAEKDLGLTAYPSSDDGKHCDECGHVLTECWCGIPGCQ